MNSSGTNVNCRKIAIATCAAALSGATLRADLARDAGKVGATGGQEGWIMENAIGFERGPAGSAWKLETGIQHIPSFAPRMSLLLESALWEREKSEGEPAVDGAGDTDFTVNYLLVPQPESGCWPGVVIGGKVKIPTGGRDIGTGEADYSALLTFGREFGELDINLELEYATFGQPDDDPARLRDQFIFALSLAYGLTDRLSAFLEISGNNRPEAGENGSLATAVGLEFEVEINDHANLFTQAGIDTAGLCEIKLGVEWSW